MSAEYAGGSPNNGCDVSEKCHQCSNGSKATKPFPFPLPSFDHHLLTKAAKVMQASR